jgi:hypothetical protein
MDEKAVRAILEDWHIRGTTLTVVGVCIILAPHVALAFQVPVPNIDVKWIGVIGYGFTGAGIGSILGYFIASAYYALPIFLHKGKDKEGPRDS